MKVPIVTKSGDVRFVEMPLGRFQVPVDARGVLGSIGVDDPNAVFVWHTMENMVNYMTTPLLHYYHVVCEQYMELVGIVQGMHDLYVRDADLLKQQSEYIRSTWAKLSSCEGVQQDLGSLHAWFVSMASQLGVVVDSHAQDAGAGAGAGVDTKGVGGAEGAASATKSVRGKNGRRRK